jgi:hypothetical protein
MMRTVCVCWLMQAWIIPVAAGLLADARPPTLAMTSMAASSAVAAREDAVRSARRKVLM